MRAKKRSPARKGEKPPSGPVPPAVPVPANPSANMPDTATRSIEELGSVQIKIDPDGKIAFKDKVGAPLFQKLKRTFGTGNWDLLISLMEQAMGPANVGKASEGDYNSALAAVQGIGAANALEGMFAVQMVGMHNMAMAFMKRACLSEQTVAGVDMNVDRANKCLRTFAALVDGLNRLRGKGNQTVVVKHVSVNQGGQAIVGQVSGPANRGGGG